MRSTLALKHQYDEVPVSSTEVLEANVVAIRDELKELKADYKEHKADFRAVVSRLDSEIRNAVAKIDNDIKSAVARLEAEIRAMAAKAEKDLQIFADRVESQLAELRADNKSLREKVDNNFDRLCTKIDETNKAISDLSKTVIKIDSRQTAIVWVGSGLIALITLAITVGKAFNWF